MLLAVRAAALPAHDDVDDPRAVLVASSGLDGRAALDVLGEAEAALEGLQVLHVVLGRPESGRGLAPVRMAAEGGDYRGRSELCAFIRRREGASDARALFERRTRKAAVETLFEHDEATWPAADDADAEGGGRSNVTRVACRRSDQARCTSTCCLAPQDAQPNRLSPHCRSGRLVAALKEHVAERALRVDTSRFGKGLELRKRRRPREGCHRIHAATAILPKLPS